MKIAATDKKGKTLTFDSINQAEKELHIAKKTISKYIGGTYNGIKFSIIEGINEGVFEGVTIDEKPERKPRILFIDIETAPCIVWTFGIFKQHIAPHQIMADRFVICWAAKWLYESEILSDCCTPKEMINRTDKRIIQSIYDLINTADIVIAHNGLRFDKPILNSRFLIHKLPPTNPYQFVDTCQVFKKSFGHTSNKLDFINQSLGLPQKEETNYKLWLDCLDGQREALQRMLDYNKNDVAILQDLYLIIRPYIKSHPNLGLFYDEAKEMCPNCGSTKIKYDGNYYNTMVSKFSTFRCECGYVGRCRTSALSKDKRKTLTTTCAR